MLDLILRNGCLMDPQNGLDGLLGDIAIKNGEIVELGEIGSEPALHEIDLEGLTVTPGLIDFHAHFYDGGTNTSLDFSRYLATGVTNAVDAGSAGYSNIENFISSLSEQERRNVKLFLYFSSEGQCCVGEHNECINPKYFNEEKILRICKKYPDLIMGLKLRISEEVAEFSNTTGFASLRRGIEIAEACQLPVSVHMPNFQGELKELIDILRKDDIFCHVFTPQKGILVDGAVSDEMFRAVEKGIVLESACGKGHFGHECTAKALALGLKPDIISGDITKNTFGYEPVISLPYLMSRFLALGMNFADVLACCTSFPAKKMGMADVIGCLKKGARANIAVFERKQGNYTFTDVRGVKINGSELLVPMLTVLEGELAFRNHAAF